MEIRSEAWITEQANEILFEFVKCNKNLRIVEFGAGASTLWFLKQPNVIELISIEHDTDWINKIIRLQSEIKTQTAFTLIPHKLPYYSFCENLKDNSFDLILVDGRNRNGCIQHAHSKLKKGGTLILDNSERDYYSKGISLFSDWKRKDTVQEVPDKYGFTYQDPENKKFWQTSFFTKPE